MWLSHQGFWAPPGRLRIVTVCWKQNRHLHYQAGSPGNQTLCSELRLRQAKQRLCLSRGEQETCWHLPPAQAELSA